MLILAAFSAVLVLLSFVASSMEAALFTVTSIQIEDMVERKLSGARMLLKNKQNIHDSIIAIVILNNLSNIGGSILVGTIAGELFSNLWLGVFSGSLTFVIILLGEVVPKTIGERHATSYARFTAGTVRILRIAFKPFIMLMKAMISPFGISTDSLDRVSEDEITLLARIGHRDGHILESENQLIRNVFQLNDILARDIMTPRTVVFAMQAERLLEDVRSELFEAPVSRIPIYGEDLDDIRGVVHIRDLLAGLARDEGGRPLQEFADEAGYIPETAKADVLLKRFQKNREHLAVVIDEYGGMAGVLTLEDILEQLVGEIVDEYDSDVDMRVRARLLKERKEGDQPS